MTGSKNDSNAKIPCQKMGKASMRHSPQCREFLESRERISIARSVRKSGAMDAGMGQSRSEYAVRGALRKEKPNSGISSNSSRAPEENHGM